MRIQLYRFIALLACTFAPPGSPSAQEPDVPPEVWVDRVQSVRSFLAGETPQWSPDGSRIMFASSLGGSSLWSISPDGGFPQRMVEDIGGVPFQLARHPQWSPTGEWVSYLSDRAEPGGAPEVWLWSPVDGRSIQLTRLGSRIGSADWSPDGQSIAFSAALGGNLDIWTVAVPSGEVRRLTTDSRPETVPVWTPDSKQIVYVLVDDRWVDHDVMVMQADGDEQRLVVRDEDFFDYRTTNGHPGFAQPQISSNGRSLLIRSWRSGWINYWSVPLKGGPARAIAPEEWDQSHARWSPDGEHISFVSNRNGTHVLRVVPASGGESRLLVEPDMGMVAAPEWSPDGRAISYTFATPTSAPDLFVVSHPGGESRQVTFSAPGGKVSAALITPEKIQYKSDDLTINAYVYEPPGAGSGDRYPGMVFAHGGPTGQYNDTYQLQMQFFARQGYVVLAPNFRGGSGYGKEFSELNDGCWAHCDLDDLVAGVEYLKTLPYVDPDNMGITGTSHGGLLSMAGATFANGVFKASIPHGGTADRIHYYHTQEFRHVKQAEDEFGVLEGNEHVYRYVSPFYYAEQVDTPMFVIWGEGRWPASDSSANYVAELERHYKPHRAKVYYDENYYVSGRANVRQMLLDMLDFFDQYLKGSENGPRIETSSR